jgi:hypothetical protein
LIRKTLSGKNPDALHFMSGAFLEYFVTPPRPFRFLEHPRILVICLIE